MNKRQRKKQDKLGRKRWEKFQSLIVHKSRCVGPTTVTYFRGHPIHENVYVEEPVYWHGVSPFVVYKPAEYFK